MAKTLSSHDRDEVSFFFQYYEDIDIPMFLCSGEGTIWWINRAMEDFAGIKSDNAAGSSCRELLIHLFGTSLEEVGEVLEQTRKKAYLLTPPGKTDVWMEISSTIIKNGIASGARLFFFRNITESIRKEDEIYQRNAIQAVLEEISTIITSGSAGGLDAGIQKSLHQIGECIGVNRCYLFIIQSDGTELRSEYEWNRNSIPHAQGLTGVRFFEFPLNDEMVATTGPLRTIHTGENRQSDIIPIKGRRMRGFFGFEGESGNNPYLQHSAGLLRLAGEMIINALEHQQVEETLTSHDSLNESVMTSSGKFLLSSDWETIIPDVLEWLGTGTGVDRASIMEFPREDRKSRSYEWLSSGTNSGSEKGIFWDVKGLTQWTAALSLGHVITGKVKDMPPEMADLFRQRSVHSFVILPIFAGEQCWGSMLLEDCTRDRVWSKSEIDALKTAADSLGSTIERMNRELEIQDRNRQLSIVNEIISAAGSSASRDELLDTMLCRTMDLLDVEEGAIYLIENENGVAELKCKSGNQNEASTFVSELNTEDALYHLLVSEGAAIFEEKGITWIPLGGGNSPVGILALGVRGGHSFSSYELTTFETIGREMGTAIEKMALQVKLGESYKKANLYLDIMAHDIKNATTVSIMYSDMLREMLEGEPKEYAEKLMESIRRTIEITDHVSTIRRLHEEKPVLNPQNLDDVIQLEIEQHPNAKIHYSPSSFMVLADDLIHEIFANLIGNSIKYGGDDVEIFIRVASIGHNVEVSIEDTGPGIADEVKNVIFNRFQRGESNESGKGLGLYIVKMLVDRYCGSIQVLDRVHGHPDQGVAFRFTLNKTV